MIISNVIDERAYRDPARATLVFDRETRAESDPRGQFREFWEKEPPQRAG